MEGYWRVYLKNGHVLSFANRVHYVDVNGDKAVVNFVEHRGGCVFAIIPTANILWIEWVEPEEVEE